MIKGHWVRGRPESPAFSGAACRAAALLEPQFGECDGDLEMRKVPSLELQVNPDPKMVTAIPSNKSHSLHGFG